MPLTFKHAIAIARRLGYQYLWIDSLCIVQDSDEDWMRESAMMGQIYSFSQCTIAATGSSNSHGGCFVKRKPLELQPCRISGNILSAQNASEDLYLYDWHTERFSEELADAPLNSRAWVLQERILSPRVLHYNGRQLFWECKRYDACEAFPQGLSIDYNRYNGRAPTNFKKVLASGTRAMPERGLSEDCSPKDMMYLDWHSVVESYSTADLTKARDKLVAISGLAREWRLRLGNEYFAGLWKNDLHRELLWHMQLLEEGTRKRTSTYRAPTWSWASFDAKVYNATMVERMTDCIIVGRIITVQVTPAGSDPMGQITSASLEIVGPMRKSSIYKDSHGLYHIPDATEGYSDEHIEAGGWYSSCNPDVELTQLAEVTYLPLL
ncbi:MAG: hypothetical protein Q9187_007804, partial [Circinaria calcarea]